MRRTLISAAALVLLAAPSAWADPPADRGHGEGHGGDSQGRPQAEANHPAPPQMNQGGGGRGPAPQAAMQPQNQPATNRGFDRGNRGPAPQMAIQAPPDRGGQNRDFNRGDRNRGPAPQMAIQAPPDRGDNNRSGGFDGRGSDRRTFNDNRGGVDRGDNNRAGGFDARGSDRRAFNDNRGDFNREGRTNYRSPGFGGPRHDFSGFRDFHRDFRAAHRFQVPSYRRPAGWYSRRWAFGEFLPAAFWARDYWLVDFADYDLPPPPFGAIWVRVDRDALLVDEDSGEIITVAYDVFY